MDKFAKSLDNQKELIYCERIEINRGRCSEVIRLLIRFVDICDNPYLILTIVSTDSSSVLSSTHLR